MKNMEGVPHNRLLEITRSPNGTPFAYEHRSMASELILLRQRVEELDPTDKRCKLGSGGGS